MPADASIILYTGDEEPPAEVEVPSVVGLLPEAANKAITNAGLYVRVTGARDTSSVKVFQQSPSAGEKEEMVTVVEIEFRDMNDIID
jgi:stage V sporulation protein D (sporulation-specific penicillin-binding protein)